MLNIATLSLTNVVVYFGEFMCSLEYIILYSYEKKVYNILDTHVHKQVFICLFVTICDCSTTVSGWVFMISVGFNAAARLDSSQLVYKF
jgi:hypothetical protein